MRYVLLGITVLLAGACLTGCGDTFPTDTELNLGDENKTRPYAVVIEPAEAAPGEAVQVTLRAWTNDASNLDISWRVALDYNIGLYEVDEVERNYVTLDTGNPALDQDGFLEQTFWWTVPEDLIVESSGLPEVLTDPAMIMLAEELMGPEASSPPLKSEVDAWLAQLTPEEVAGMDPLQQQYVWALADRFAVQVRFRAALHTDLVIDVTRNMTVRHTTRLGGPNGNTNPRAVDLAVVAIDKVDAEPADLDNPAIDRQWHYFINDYIRQDFEIEVTLRDDWTYYLYTSTGVQRYSSPFDPELELLEETAIRWYYYRQDQPNSDHQLFVNDDGEELDDWDMGNYARLAPDGAGSTFRVLSVVRDERSDWVMYHATPGVVIEEAVVEFVGE